MKGVPEKLDKLHPTLVHRVTALLNDPALKGRYGIESGARTFQHQVSLWERWRAGKFSNVVANPYRVLRTGPDFPYSWVPKGSWHMVQYDGYAHAVDLARPWNHTRAMARKRVHPLLAKYGLVAPVPSEWWHVQALTSAGWVPGPEPLSEEENDMITALDNLTGEAWVCADGKARPLKDPASWLASFDGPVRRANHMGAVVADLYEIV